MINKMYANLQFPSNQTEMKTEAKTNPNKCSVTSIIIPTVM
jgi:hypothetical protein